MATIKKQNLRAKATVHKMVANGGKRRSLAQAMREAGYSESYARNPQKIKETKTWQEYLDEYIPDEQVAVAHKALLGAQRVSRMEFPASLTDDEVAEIIASSGRSVLVLKRSKKTVSVAFAEPDFTTQVRAIDLAYKVKGLYKSGETEAAQSEYAHLSDEELHALIEQYKGFFKHANPLPSL
jgi:hypothetical protein